MKKQYMILVLAALSVISCQKNDFETVYAGGDSIVRFAPSMAEVSYADGLTKSAAASADQSGLSLSAADGSFSLPMFHETVEGIVKGTFTKGELYNETTGDVSLGKYVDDFMVAAWNTPEGGTSVKVIPDDKVMTSESYVTNGYQKVMKRTGADGGEYWMTVQGQLDDFKSTLPDADDEYIWKSGETKTFYAYANLPRSGASMQVDGSGQTLTYSVQATAAAQTDILLGSYTGNGGDKGTAEIHFGHPLTAVMFKQGDMPGVTGIRSISLSGLASGGTVAMDADGKIGDWTVDGTEAYKTEVTLSPSGEATTLGVDEDTKLIGTDATGNYNGAFLLVPQDLASHKATVTVVLVTASGDVTVSADITSGKWEVGKTNTYTLGYTGSYEPDLLPGKFSVSAIDYVQFSGGNLRYTVASSKWSFFDEQYECGPSSYSSGHDKEISLFTWGYDAAKSIIPDGASTDNVSRTSGDLSLSEDWGYVFGGASSPWRTLTIAEWKYLFNTRTDAASKVGYATVGGVKGIIILPDTFTDPMKNGGSGAFKPKSTTGYSANVYTSGGNWEAMEAAGAVFLPAAGTRNGSNLQSDRVDWLYYWSSSAEYGSKAFGVSFYSTSPYLDYSYNRSLGYSVRLVQKVHDAVKIGGKYWATMNVGATTVAGSPSTCYGDYFAWGETEPYYSSMTINDASSITFNSWKDGKSGGYAWTNYRYCTGAEKTLTKYNDDSTYGTVTDNKTFLESADDAATSNWGGTWRTPTMDDFIALCEDCGCTFTNYSYTLKTGGTSSTTEKGVYWCDNYDGVPGVLFSNGTNKVFFPAAGRCSGTTNGSDYAGHFIRYWTSRVYKKGEENGKGDNAWGFFSDKDGYLKYDGYGPRQQGRSVRPVHD